MPHLQRAPERGSPGCGGAAARRWAPALSLDSPSPDAGGPSGLSSSADAVRRYDRERFRTTLFASRAAREDLFALYAFNIEIAKIREVVSQPMLGQIRLKWWMDALDEVYGGGPVRRHDVLGALAAAIAAHDLPRDEFDRLIEGRLLDMAEAPPPDLAALALYADSTSGSLARLALGILGVVEEATVAASRAVGTAWALTGLLRAVPFHAAARRLYLPQDRLDAHGVDPEALFAGTAPPGAAAVIREVADLARQQLAAARRHRTIRAALPVLMLAALADRHLLRLAKARYDPFAAAARPVSPAAGMLRLLWIAATGRF